MAVNGCNALLMRETEEYILSIFDFVPPTPKSITSLHSIAAMKACLSAEKHGVKGVYCSPTCKSLFYLEHYHGFFFKNQYNPQSKMIRINLMLQPPGEEQTWMVTDEFKRGDYLFMENMSPQERATIESVIEANELCQAAVAAGKSAKFLSEHMENIRKSQCPCPLPYLMLFEVMAIPAATSRKCRVAAGVILRNAVEAGRKLVDIVQVNKFCEGNLYSYEPTRNYIRALYLRGSYLFIEGKLDEACDILQECIANDIHDKMGARHKQLLVVLEMGSIKKAYDKRLPDLLAAKFGDDQVIDDVLALWNYTRALYHFFIKGDSKKTRRLLNHAIDRNPFVPQLLLRYESEVMSWAERKVMSVGELSEANDYVQDSRHHWKQNTGSLDWLEEVYALHNRAILPEMNRAGRKLLSKGNRLFATRDSSDLEKAIVKYKDLFKIAETKNKYSTMRLLSLERIGCCYKFLGNSDEAMKYFQNALSLHKDLKNNIDLHKEVLYQVADCKEEIGDFEGALECHHTVLNSIGKFVIASEGITRIEEKMDRKNRETPSESDKEDINDDGAGFSDAFQHMMYESIKTESDMKRCYHDMDRCFHCKRGGVKLSFCALCKEDHVKYCSKTCQKTSWHHIHKYVCRGSKFNISANDTIIVKNLERTPQFNGMKGKVVKYSDEKERYVICLVGTESNILVKPQNIERIKGDSLG